MHNICIMIYLCLILKNNNNPNIFKMAAKFKNVVYYCLNISCLHNLHA